MNTEGLGFLGLNFKTKSFCERGLKLESVGSESGKSVFCLSILSKTFAIQKIRQINTNINDKGARDTTFKA